MIKFVARACYRIEREETCTVISQGDVLQRKMWNRSKTLITLILLMWRIGWAPNSIPIYSYIQQDTTLHSLFISGNYSTCFGWYFHTSSEAHTTISTAVGGVRHPQNTQTSSNSSTIAADSSNGVKNTRYCRYSRLLSWWWVMVPPETCRAVSR